MGRALVERVDYASAFHLLVFIYFLTKTAHLKFLLAQSNMNGVRFWHCFGDGYDFYGLSIVYWLSVVGGESVAKKAAQGSNVHP
jgi:hypothetical protein